MPCPSLPTMCQPLCPAQLRLSLWGNAENFRKLQLQAVVTNQCISNSKAMNDNPVCPFSALGASTWLGGLHIVRWSAGLSHFILTTTLGSSSAAVVVIVISTSRWKIQASVMSCKTSRLMSDRPGILATSPVSLLGHSSLPPIYFLVWLSYLQFLLKTTGISFLCAFVEALVPAQRALPSHPLVGLPAFLPTI